MNPILQVRQVNKRYGKVAALSGVSFDVAPGRIVGLLGPNGSGKTTLIKIICGLTSDYEGVVVIGDNPPGLAAKREIAYLPDRESLPDWLKVKDVLRYFADFYDDFDIARAAEMLVSLKVDAEKRVKALSKGMKEKLQLALVMCRRPKLYILDEPIAGVDPAARDLIMRTILQNFHEGASILLSTHIISDVEALFDDVIFLKDGEIALAGPAEDIRAREGKSIDQLFREVFAC
ncbi:MAG: ABC transporter ATP-binding protein [Oscillospiraceae bacterium]|jgi:ABC-2 type transport system ATP-binding protein|nr:ABC transporter ATP-binding protein [Oscillospiraceae bacterium]